MSEGETKLSNEVVEPMTKDGGAENQAPAETKPVSDEAAKPEDVKIAACYACCLVGATCVVCFPCYIFGVAIRCLLLPCKCVSVFCCPSEETLPVKRPAA